MCPINNAILLHCLHLPHSAFYRSAGLWRHCGFAVIRGMTAVMWFGGSTNQPHSAFSIPHFTLRIPQFRILPTTPIMAKQYWSFTRFWDWPNIRHTLANIGPICDIGPIWNQSWYWRVPDYVIPRHASTANFTYLFSATWRMTTDSYDIWSLWAIDRQRWGKLLGNRNPVWTSWGRLLAWVPTAGLERTVKTQSQGAPILDVESVMRYYSILHALIVS